MTLEGDTLLKLQKWWDAIFSYFCQSLSTNKSWPTCKNLVSEHHYINKFLLPIDDHSKYITAKENYEAFSRALRVHLVKDTTISSSKAPKSHIKLVTHMHYDNGFELLIALIFNVISQLGGLGPKSKDLVIPFCLGKLESLTEFHLISIAIKSDIILMGDKTGQINNLTGKYIMELSKLKHIQGYMTSFEVAFRKFERHPQSYQLKHTFVHSKEIIFETLETDDIDMNSYQSMIEPIVNRNFGNTFYHQNGPN